MQVSKLRSILPAAAALLFTASLMASGAVACDIDEILSRPFLWPGQEESKFLYENSKYNPEYVLFDSVHSYDALHYALDLDFPMDGPYFEGSMRLTFRVVDDDLSSISLHMIHLVEDSVFLQEDPADYFRNDTTIVVDIDGPHPAGETLSVTIYYHDFTTNRGYYYYERDAYTMSEPSDARWWFPCFDEPWDKATSEIRATVPESYDVGSNGYLESVEHDQQNHTRTYHWVNDYPISTYLMNLIMGDYAVWTDYYVAEPQDSIPILNMVFAEDSSDAAFDFAVIPSMMEIFSDLYYPYPFNKYGQGAVSPFYYGGMEHQTMTTINRSWIPGDGGSEGGLSHELAHMWWGDFVTLSDWRHIWLNEGFATYSTALFDEVYHDHEKFIQDLQEYRQAYLDYVEVHGYEPLFDPDYVFNTPEYVKGAWVLHMLRGMIGDNAFFGGLHYYASLYGYGNASTADFEAAMEAVSNMGLDWFFEQWIYRQAHPIYHYAWSVDGQGPYTVHLEVLQVQTAAPPFRMPVGIRIETTGGDHDFLIDNRYEYQTYDFEISDLPVDLQFDPDYWILKEIEEVTSLEGPWPGQLPDRAEILSAFPNPFNSTTSLSFVVEGHAQEVVISIYDLSGRLVDDMGAKIYAPGYYSVAWDGKAGGGGSLSSGIYFVRLTSPAATSTTKITLLK
jgi:aminopeptidase N